MQKLLSFLSTKNINVFGYKVVKHLTSLPFSELVKLMMLWTTGPRGAPVAHLVKCWHAELAVTGSSPARGKSSPVNMVPLHIAFHYHQLNDLI